MFVDKLFYSDIKKLNDERPPLFREQKVGWPSEALAPVGPFRVGECRRALFYKSLGIPLSDKMPLRVRKICDSGIMYENELIQAFKKAGVFDCEQIRIEFVMPNTVNNVLLSGKMDAVVFEDNMYKGIEIKTVEGFKAQKIFGTPAFGSSKEGLALPAPKNLMQAMLYKYRARNGEIDGKNIQKVYLAYVNRGDYTTTYFEVDIDEEGYPIITHISMEGKVGETIRLADVLSFDDLAKMTKPADSEQARLAELRININDIFKNFDDVYNYISEEILPPMDYTLVYTDEQAKLEHQCGRMSTIKYNKHNKGEKQGDSQCSYCNYRSKCLKDNGITIL